MSPAQRTHWIYILIHPITKDVRYVGKTVHPSRRLRDHLCEARQSQDTHRLRWVMSVVAEGFKPTLLILEECDDSSWQAAEMHWIAFFRAMGFKLTNGSDGGEGNRNYTPTDLTRQRLSAARRGKKLSPEHIANSSAGRTGLKRTEEQKARMSDAQKKIVRPAKRAMKDMTGANNPFFGKKHSEETIQKLSAAKIGKPSLKKGVPASEAVWRHRCKAYILTDPNGVEHVTDHLAKFCSDRGLTRSNLLAIIAGRATHHKGWKMRKADQ